MPRVRVFYHFVWSTWDRVALLEGDIERHAYALMRQECTEKKCLFHAVGGTADHVHLLVSLPTTLCIADFVHDVKGGSSRALNEAHGSELWTFKWQGGYGVTTVGPRDVRRVVRYIEHQQEHHAAGDLWESLEKTEEEQRAAEPGLAPRGDGVED